VSAPTTRPMNCAGCTEQVEFLIDRVFIAQPLASLAGSQPKVSAVKLPRLTCPLCGWRVAVLSMRTDGVLSVHELSGLSEGMTMTETEAVLDACPECSVTGPDVYRAGAHPTSCRWMMRTARRCLEHDELLRPDEADCPAPDVDEEADDPHGRAQEGVRS
jgi:hypothetical protein